jgi:D-3-phosphoglycerate dehydrogenase
MQETAARRLGNIIATVQPQQHLQNSLVPTVCASKRQSFAEMEGSAIARVSASKVCLFCMGERGVPLGAMPSIIDTFTKASLEVTSVNGLNELPADTNVLVTTGAAVGPDVLSKVPKCVLVAVAFTGYDHVDVEACKARGISVTYVPGYATDSTAELALSLVLAHMHNLQACHDNIAKGSWEAPEQDHLDAKTVGIVGTGNLGVRCAEIFKAMKVKNIIGYDLSMQPAFTSAGGSYTNSIAELFLESQIIIICVPLTDETRGMISARLLTLLRPECILVNVSRGDVVDEVAMAELLKERRFRAALDVFSMEPLRADDPLRAVPSDVLLMTPHVGYQSLTTLRARFDATVKNILAFLAGHAINVV